MAHVLSFQPRLLECLRGYSRARFATDVLAELTVGVVALPLSIGLGVASGVTPGAPIKFIPHPVTTGFTCGIAITIIVSQVKDFFGLQLDAVPPGFFENGCDWEVMPCQLAKPGAPRTGSLRCS